MNNQAVKPMGISPYVHTYKLPPAVSMLALFWYRDIQGECPLLIPMSTNPDLPHTGSWIIAKIIATHMRRK